MNPFSSVEATTQRKSPFFQKSHSFVLMGQSCQKRKFNEGLRAAYSDQLVGIEKTEYSSHLVAISSLLIKRPRCL